MRSPLLPELTLLQSSQHPSHAWDARHFHSVQGAPAPGASPLAEVRQAWLFLFLEVGAGSRLKVKAGIFREMGFLPIPYWCQYTSSPCCLPPHTPREGGASVINWI